MSSSDFIYKSKGFLRWEHKDENQNRVSYDYKILDEMPTVGDVLFGYTIVSIDTVDFPKILDSSEEANYNYYNATLSPFEDSDLRKTAYFAVSKYIGKENNIEKWLHGVDNGEYSSLVIINRVNKDYQNQKNVITAEISRNIAKYLNPVPHHYVPKEVTTDELGYKKVVAWKAKGMISVNSTIYDFLHEEYYKTGKTYWQLLNDDVFEYQKVFFRNSVRQYVNYRFSENLTENEFTNRFYGEEKKFAYSDYVLDNIYDDCKISLPIRELFDDLGIDLNVSIKHFLNDYKENCLPILNKAAAQKIANENFVRVMLPDNSSFYIKDGGKIEITTTNGRAIIERCEYVDCCHFNIGDNLVHELSFAEDLERCNLSVQPLGEEYKDYFDSEKISPYLGLGKKKTKEMSL